MPSRTLAIALLATLMSWPTHAGERERRITDALIWAGQSERVARGRLDGADRRAIQRFERRVDGFADGRLDGREESILLGLAERRKSQEGYRTVVDPRTGARIGLPGAWFGRGQATGEGTRWRSPDGAITISTFRDRRSLGNRRAREVSRGGEITYRTGGRDWFVLSGYRNGQAYYVRAAARNGEVRGYRVEYDPALRSRFDPVVVAMSSDFTPFAAAPSAGVGPVEPRFALLPPSGPIARMRPVETARLEEPVARIERPEPSRTPPRTTEPTEDAGVVLPPLASEFGPSLPDETAPRPVPRAGLQPLSEEPTPDTGEEVERAVPSEITGMLTDEGQSCPTLRGADGALYAMVGEVPSVEPGTMVTIEATEVASERCSAGRTVAVSGFRVRLPR